MQRNNLYFFTVLFLFSIVLSVFSGSGYYWNDGEIVRAPEINFALDQKMSKSGEAFLIISASTGFATSTAPVGTIYRNASGAINFLATGTTWMTLQATTTGIIW